MVDIGRETSVTFYYNPISRKIFMSDKNSRVSKASHIFVSVVLFGLTLIPIVSNAHKEPIHEQIAWAAVQSSDGLTRFANETIGGTEALLKYNPFEFTPPSQGYSPKDWVGRGAFNQDYWPRWGNHFYTVKPNRTVGEARGLNDISEGFFGILPGPTTNSFAWATVPGITTPILWNILAPFRSPPPPVNVDNWASARESQYNALTSVSKLVRDGNMAHMFFSLGHIIHLNQDTSQPDHTRDDAHPFRANIEKYGEDNYQEYFNAFDPVPRGWAYWRDQAGFKKLRDFWDRGFYRGNAWALDLDASGNATYKLGLAEFSNGNLMGENALYTEFFEPTDTQYFPYPSLKNTDQPQLKLGSFLQTLETVTLENGKQGKRPYLKKIGAGINVQHHSALKYFAAVNTGKMDLFPARVAVSINDPVVLFDYHAIMIPKAIEYSAGILDYFFRGKFDVVSAVWDGTALPPHYTIKIRNKSGESFKDGTFTLFKDDTMGNRSAVGLPFTYTGTLAHDDTKQLVFDSPQLTSIAKLILVYKGTIGLTDNAPSDDVDKEIAIAVKPVDSWHSSFEVSPFGQTFYEGEILADGWVVDFGNVDNVIVDLNDAPSYEGQSFLDLNGVGPVGGVISANVFTVPGQTYTLSFAYARNPFTILGHGNVPPVVPQAEFCVDSYCQTIIANSMNSWASLGWQTISYNFTAATASTHLVFRSVNTSGDGGVLIDAVDVKPKP